VALAELMSTVPLGMAIIDPELRYVEVSEAMAAMNGLPRENGASLSFDPKDGK
jgi:hypothetical protein